MGKLIDFIYVVIILRIVKVLKQTHLDCGIA